VLATPLSAELEARVVDKPELQLCAWQKHNSFSIFANTEYSPTSVWCTNTTERAAGLLVALKDERSGQVQSITYMGRIFRAYLSAAAI
jgi:hypothetical protein